LWLAAFFGARFGGRFGGGGLGSSRLGGGRQPESGQRRWQQQEAQHTADRTRAECQVFTAGVRGGEFDLA